MRREFQPHARPERLPNERLASVDRAFLNMERPTNPMVVVALIVFGTPVKR